MGESFRMNKRFINYLCKQKWWYSNLRDIVINYKHRGEENDIYLCHMELPKIDHTGYYPRCWRWKYHGTKREW